MIFSYATAYLLYTLPRCPLPLLLPDMRGLVPATRRQAVPLFYFPRLFAKKFPLPFPCSLDAASPRPIFRRIKSKSSTLRSYHRQRLLSIMDGSMRRQRRTDVRAQALRLEGLVVQKRLTRVETTRYLVIDFQAGSISMYKKPPPKDNFQPTSRSLSAPQKIMSSVTSSLSRSSSASCDGRGGKGPLTCENLAHMSRQARYLPSGDWDPKFTVPANVDWKLR